MFRAIFDTEIALVRPTLYHDIDYPENSLDISKDFDTISFTIPVECNWLWMGLLYSMA